MKSNRPYFVSVERIYSPPPRNRAFDSKTFSRSFSRKTCWGLQVWSSRWGPFLQPFNFFFDEITRFTWKLKHNPEIWPSSKTPPWKKLRNWGPQSILLPVYDATRFQTQFQILLWRDLAELLNYRWNCVRDVSCEVGKHSHRNTLKHTATHCNTLQHNATHASTLEMCFYFTLQHTTTRCNALQHSASHCNTLQHMQVHSRCASIPLLILHNCVIH